MALQAAGALIDSWASPFLGLKKPRHMSRAAVVLLVFGMKISMFTLIALELLQTNCLSMVSGVRGTTLCAFVRLIPCAHEDSFG